MPGCLKAERARRPCHWGRRARSPQWAARSCSPIHPGRTSPDGDACHSSSAACTACACASRPPCTAPPTTGSSRLSLLSPARRALPATPVTVPTGGHPPARLRRRRRPHPRDRRGDRPGVRPARHLDRERRHRLPLRLDRQLLRHGPRSDQRRDPRAARPDAHRTDPHRGPRHRRVRATLTGSTGAASRRAMRQFRRHNPAISMPMTGW